MVLMALIVPVFSFSIILHIVISALWVWCRLILICGEIIGFCRFFCAHARICIISLGELVIHWLLVPGVRQRFTMRMPLMSIDLDSTVLISVFIMRMLIIVRFIVLQRDIECKIDFFFPLGSSENRSLSVNPTCSWEFGLG